MSDDRRSDVNRLIQDMQDIFLPDRKFAIHRAGDKPLITSDPLVAFDNLQHRSPLHGLVFADLQKVERLAPGASSLAGQATPVILLSALVDIDGGRPWVSVASSIESNYDEILRHFEQINRWPKWNDIVELATSGLSKPERDMLMATLEIAGPAGRVYIEPSHGSSSLVERILGNTFGLDPCRAIMSNGQWRRDYVKCAVIDGIIESVAEVDRLLSECHTSRQSLVIFARGFDADVITTLAVNRARGTLDVMAVTAPYDLEFINTLNDVAVVCGGDVVSSLKGELISSVRLDDLPVVQSIHCIPGSVTVRNDITRKNVEAHSGRLLQKVQQANIEDIDRLVADRIRSLTSDYVRVLISGHTPAARQAAIERFDRALRTVRSARASGTVRWADAIPKGQLACLRPPQELFSSMALAAGLRSSHRLATHLLSILAGH